MPAQYESYLRRFRLRRSSAVDGVLAGGGRRSARLSCYENIAARFCCLAGLSGCCDRREGAGRRAGAGAAGRAGRLRGGRGAVVCGQFAFELPGWAGVADSLLLRSAGEWEAAGEDRPGGGGASRVHRRRSNNSRNGAWTVIELAARHLIRDTERRFRIDPCRRYSMGFSGGARAASAAAMEFGFAGVIAHLKGSGRELLNLGCNRRSFGMRPHIAWLSHDRCWMMAGGGAGERLRRSGARSRGTRSVAAPAPLSRRAGLQNARGYVVQQDFTLAYMSSRL